MIKINDIIYSVSSAEEMPYDNSISSMTSTNVKDALDEIWRELQLRALREYEVVYMVDTGIGYKENVQLGSTALLPESFTPTKEGYTFVGWRRDNTASGDILTECTVGEDPLTLWAVFRKSYNVNFISNVGTENFTVYEYYNNENLLNASIEAPNGISTSEWKWRGWSGAQVTTADASVVYNNGTLISNIISNSTYYGLYSQNVTISYNANGGSGTLESHTGTRYYNASGDIKDATIVLKNNSFTRSGAIFHKWAIASAVTSTQYAAGTSVTISTNTVYYATWKKSHSVSSSRSGDVNGTVFDYVIAFGCTFVDPPTVTVKFTQNEDGKYTSCSATNITTTQWTLHMTKIGTTNPRVYAVSWTASGYIYVV